MLALCPPEDVEAGREFQRRCRIDYEEALESDAGVVLDATEGLEVCPLRPREPAAPRGGADRTDRRGEERCPPDRAQPPAPRRAQWPAGGHRRGGRSRRGDDPRGRCRATPASWRLLALGTGVPPGWRRSPH